jgi:RecB family endonuclease NucS
MILEDDFFPEPKQYPSNVTVTEICERFTAAGLSCRAERQEDEVRIIFKDRKSNLRFTVNASGIPLTATMPEETDYDADFASVIFEVFDSLGWSYAPS